MYPWVTHTHSHLGGECPHHCLYCYVNNPRFGRAPRYQGEPRLIEKEFDVQYGTGKTIFVENCNDLFAIGVPGDYIVKVLNHCRQWPENTYVLQTKNPARYRLFLDALPEKHLLGCTLETNRLSPQVSDAPVPVQRIYGMQLLKLKGIRRFVTIEPILDFDIAELATAVLSIMPEFVNIGADSKGHGLAEPTIEKVMELGRVISAAGIEVKKKRNLDRLRRVS